MSISIRDGRGALRLVLCALFCLLPAACGGKEPVDDVVAGGTVILEPPSADGGGDDGHARTLLACRKVNKRRDINPHRFIRGSSRLNGGRHSGRSSVIWRASSVFASKEPAEKAHQPSLPRCGFLC